MQRVKHDKEMDLMAPLTNRKNIEKFSDLIPKFFYDRETEKEILANLSPLTKPFPHNHLDNLLDLNSQFRAWYEVPIDKNTDLAWEQYTRMIYNNITHFKFKMREYEEFGFISSYLGHTQPTEDELIKIGKIKIVEDYGLDDYNTFANGKVTNGKNTRKLFRFCLQKKILDQAQIDKLNTLNTNDRHLYICMSRNPIDYLFASTNQSYGSCISIDSRGEGCFWLGLGALNVDTSRALVFLSNGKLKNHSIKGFAFKHYGYLSRSWVIVGKHNELFLAGAYPQDKVGFKEHLKLAGYKCPSYKDFTQSILNFRMSRFEDGAECNIYLDTFGVTCRTKQEMEEKKSGNKHRTWCYTNEGTTGSLHHFDYDGNFEDLRNFEDLFEGGCWCEDCGNRFHDDDMYYFDNIGSICYSCFENNYIRCNHCSEPVFNDQVLTGTDNCEYCERCFNNKYYMCDCGNAVEHDYACYVDGEAICDSCLDQDYFRCEDCGEYFHNEDRWMHGANEYCRDCYDNQYTECAECGDTIDYDDAIDIDYCSYCDICANTIREENENEAINEAV